MDERTEELRDVFREVTGTDTVTEAQSADRGTLAGDDDVERIRAVVAEMRDRFGLGTDLDDDALVTVVRAALAGESDAAIADRVDATEAAVFGARMDLHLVRPEDAPVDLDALREAVAAVDDPDDPDAAFAERLDASPEAVALARRGLAARERSRDVSGRYRDAFLDAVPEAAAAESFSLAGWNRDLDDLTEDMDSLEEDADLSF